MENQDLLMDMFNFDQDQMSEGANVQRKHQSQKSQTSQRDFLKQNLGLVDTNLPKKTLNVKKSLVAQNAKRKEQIKKLIEA